MLTNPKSIRSLKENSVYGIADWNVQAYHIGGGENPEQGVFDSEIPIETDEVNG